MRRILSLAGALAIVAAAGVSAVHAQPTPPTRFFGTATLDGRPAPDGTTITGFVGSNNCGTGTVTGGSYTVDVASASTKSGCGTDGATVTFTIGSARASQTGTFQTGAFVSLNLTAAQATATPSPAPTASPTPVRTATPVVTLPPTTATPVRTATPVVTPSPVRTPTPAPVAQAPAAAPRLPSTGTGPGSESGSLWLLGALAALIALGGAGVVAYRRR